MKSREYGIIICGWYLSWSSVYGLHDNIMSILERHVQTNLCLLAVCQTNWSEVTLSLLYVLIPPWAGFSKPKFSMVDIDVRRTFSKFALLYLSLLFIIQILRLFIFFIVIVISMICATGWALVSHTETNHRLIDFYTSSNSYSTRLISLQKLTSSNWILDKLWNECCQNKWYNHNMCIQPYWNVLVCSYNGAILWWGIEMNMFLFNCKVFFPYMTSLLLYAVCYDM